MPLNPIQQQALPILDWLFDESAANRGSGRTYVMAVSLIRAALKRPGVWISYRDHFTMAMAHRTPRWHCNVARDLTAQNDYMRGYVADLIGESVDLVRLDWEICSRGFRLKASAAINDWVPDTLSGTIAEKDAQRMSAWDRLGSEDFFEDEHEAKKGSD